MALVITIIVMLILVGVTVITAINGNLIGLAKNTGKKYDNEMKNEVHAYENVMSEYGIEIEKTIKFTIEGDTTEYTAIEGMDLQEWIMSKYNTTGYSIASSSEVFQPGNNIARLFYWSDKITDGCTIKEHVIHFTIGGNSYICPEYFNSWEKWAESKYNTIDEDSDFVLACITIDATGKGAYIDKTSKPEEGHAYGWNGPVI